MTLQEYADAILTPNALALAGLPDTPEGREALDSLIDALTDDPSARG